MRHITLAVCLALLLPVAATAEEPSASKNTLLEAALGRASALQGDDPDRVRSMGRTWAGVAMLGGGAFLAAHAATSTCATTSFASAFLDTQTCGQAWTKLGAGLGVVTVGVLLATVFSDVPARPSIAVDVGPGRIRIGKTFSF